ncbi:MAG: glycosyl transferase [Gemmatimonadetes bacterium]|nr:glycosyl transferase [Gemmatimonadota bacterium]HCV23779.1 glycosyl transferase [Candidatus Latescibacterota bacterium]
MLTKSIAALLVSWVLTLLLLRGARRFQWVDRPNRRSSHSLPTPTLGGIAILLGTLTGLWLNDVPDFDALVLASGVLVLIVVDDIGRPIAARTKLLLQILTGALWVTMVSLPPIQLPGIGSVSGWVLSILAVFWLISWMNVFNFMDGIDAISGTQTIVAGVSLAILLGRYSAEHQILPLTLVCAVAGFLIFNLPPARIFMGDVGSAFLGLCFGVVTLQAIINGAHVLVAILPLSAYLYDTGLTIVRRAWRRENVLQAHREHLYQRLSQRGWSHGWICLAVIGIGSMLGVAAVGLSRGDIFWPVLLSATASGLLITGSVSTWHQKDGQTDQLLDQSTDQSTISWTDQ